MTIDEKIAIGPEGSGGSVEKISEEKEGYETYGQKDRFVFGTLRIRTATSDEKMHEQKDDHHEKRLKECPEETALTRCEARLQFTQEESHKYGLLLFPPLRNTQNSSPSLCNFTHIISNPDTLPAIWKRHYPYRDSSIQNR
jgi:hypothetical protein